MLRVGLVFLCGVVCLTNVYGGYGDEGTKSSFYFNKLNGIISKIPFFSKKDQNDTATAIDVATNINLGSVKTESEKKPDSNKSDSNDRIPIQTQEEWILQQEKLKKEALIREERRQEERKREELKKEELRKEAQAGRTRILKALEFNDFQSPALRDTISCLWFEEQIQNKPYKKIFLAIGNSEQELSERTQKKLNKLIKYLVKEKYQVLYDAESRAAKWIEEGIQSDWRLGISGRESRQSQNILVIENPYLRMQTILLVSHIVSSPDSLTGLGLLIEGHQKGDVKFHILDSDRKWTQGLVDWTEYLNKTISPKYLKKKNEVEIEASQSESFIKNKIKQVHSFLTYNPPTINLEIQYRDLRKPDHARSVKGLVESLNFPHYGRRNYERPRHALSPVNLLATINQLEDVDVIPTLNWAKMYRERSITVDLDPFSRSRVIPGAVMFGSKRESDDYNEIVEDVVKVLASKKITLATGGAGGLMKIASRTAYKNGAYSIGIPLSPHYRSEAEKYTFTEYQNLTLNAPDYGVRIPLLLQNRRIILVAPGGMGTMQEFATALVKVSTGDSEIPYFIFIGENYYERLVTWFKALSLPSYFLEKVFIVNSAEEMEVILNSKINLKSEF